MSNAFAHLVHDRCGTCGTSVRQPIWIFITLVQPVVWLLLYGALFRRIVEIPGFGAGQLHRLPHAGHRRHDLPVLGRLERHGPHRRPRPRRRRPVPRQPGERGSLIAGRLVQGALVGVIQSVDHRRPRADRRRELPRRRRRRGRPDRVRGAAGHRRRRAHRTASRCSRARRRHMIARQQLRAPAADAS